MITASMSIACAELAMLFALVHMFAIACIEISNEVAGREGGDVM